MSVESLLIGRTITRRARQALSRYGSRCFTGSPVAAKYIPSPITILNREGFSDQAEQIVENLKIKKHLVLKPDQSGYYYFGSTADSQKFLTWLENKKLQKEAI